uniref:F-box domain-containing protein n=1 Tax=Glossina palpalis gambiensis TaxID=67801 RepID=A0A1B0BI51_9MUSC
MSYCGHGNSDDDDDDDVDGGNEESDSEPCAKVPRLQLCTLRPAAGVAKNLCDLPSEILEKIIGYVNIWHHNRIRATSKRMCYITDLFITHEFQKALKRNSEANQRSYKSAALRSIKLATEVYVKYGFETLFCGCMLPMLRSCYKDPFCPATQNIQKFLINFYKCIDNRLGSTQEFNLLYVLTFLRLLKSFRSFHITSSCVGISKWRCVIELQGPWLGVLWTSKSRLQSKSEDHTKILIMMTELLLAEISNEAFRRVSNCDNEICIFGYDTSANKRCPKTQFAFAVHGSKQIWSLLRSCLEENDEKFKWPSLWPKDEFMFDLEIHSKEAMKWGCSEKKCVEMGLSIEGCCDSTRSVESH